MTSVVTRARWAVATVFAVHGAASGSFAARIPWIAENLHLNEGSLGLALIMPAVGSLSTMPFTGRLVQRWGGRTATRVLIAAWSLAVGVLALAPSQWALMGMLLLAGVTAGTSDIAMNAEGVEVEQRLGRSIMSSLHGMWSVGGLIGSGIGAGAAYLDISAPVNLGVMGVLLAVVGVTAGRWLLPNAPVPASEDGPRFSLPRGPVLIIGLVGFCAVFAEGATADWCAVYLRQILDASEGQAAVAYSCFALAMAGGRLVGDAVVRRFGAVGTVRVAGIVGILGGLLVVTAWTPLVGVLGFGMIGLGCAVVVPLAFSAAGHTGDHPAHAIAGVATVSYGAGLAAPGLMGGIAHATSLPFSFGLVTGLIAIVALGAGRLRAAEIAHREPVAAGASA
ncbi:MFS transporter [Catellatospora citrea]|uniref:MFS transporter n=1 Tax=Catellatospora citrea TaxID=53366 RepID=A0A8J3KPX5_9ACTN|nr:MFS transporter [Catellatospora citrea]RKE07604.1 MFS transporter [Catellatospora citrea]GIF99189.1 MFS transporter [Catellatospora citrea]